jgi:hypothetical protein
VLPRRVLRNAHHPRGLGRFIRVEHVEEGWIAEPSIPSYTPPTAAIGVSSLTFSVQQA